MVPILVTSEHTGYIHIHDPDGMRRLFTLRRLGGKWGVVVTDEMGKVIPLPARVYVTKTDAIRKELALLEYSYEER